MVILCVKTQKSIKRVLGGKQFYSFVSFEPERRLKAWKNKTATDLNILSDLEQRWVWDHVHLPKRKSLIAHLLLFALKASMPVPAGLVCTVSLTQQRASPKWTDSGYMHERHKLPSLTKWLTLCFPVENTGTPTSIPNDPTFTQF